ESLAAPVIAARLGRHDARGRGAHHVAAEAHVEGVDPKAVDTHVDRPARVVAALVARRVRELLRSRALGAARVGVLDGRSGVLRAERAASRTGGRVAARAPAPAVAAV